MKEIILQEEFAIIFTNPKIFYLLCLMKMHCGKFNENNNKMIDKAVYSSQLQSISLNIQEHLQQGILI